jgi:hypothetical protein
MYVWYGWLLGALAVAAILGQREAQVILFLWVAWPIVKGLLLAIPKAFNNLQKRKEEKEDIEAIEAEVDVEWEDNSRRKRLPRSTRPELPDPDVVEVEWKELPAPSTPRWKQAVAMGLAVVGGLLFLAGAISFLLTLFR